MVCLCYSMDAAVCWFFFFQAEDGIRDLVRSRGLGDVYKRQDVGRAPLREDRGVSAEAGGHPVPVSRRAPRRRAMVARGRARRCLLYTSDAADERSSVDLGGRRIIKKKEKKKKRRVTTKRNKDLQELTVTHSRTTYADRS